MKINFKLRSISSNFDEDIEIKTEPCIIGYEFKVPTERDKIIPFDFLDGELGWEYENGFIIINGSFENIEIYDYQTGEVIYSDKSEDDCEEVFSIKDFTGVHKSNLKIYPEFFLDIDKQILIHFELISATFYDGDNEVKVDCKGRY